jgi:hypothetical protein
MSKWTRTATRHTRSSLRVSLRRNVSAPTHGHGPRTSLNNGVAPTRSGTTPPSDELRKSAAITTLIAFLSHTDTTRLPFGGTSRRIIFVVAENGRPSAAGV